jgi:hypothetical protein
MLQGTAQSTPNDAAHAATELVVDLFLPNYPKEQKVIIL